MIGYLEILVSRVTDVEHKWVRAPSTKALTYLTLLSPSPSVESEVERSSLHLEHEHPVTLASLFSLQTVSSGTWRCSILPQDFLKMNEIKSTKPSLLFGEQGDEGNRREKISLNWIIRPGHSGATWIQPVAFEASVHLFTKGPRASRFFLCIRKEFGSG